MRLKGETNSKITPRSFLWPLHIFHVFYYFRQKCSVPCCFSWTMDPTWTTGYWFSFDVGGSATSDIMGSDTSSMGRKILVPRSLPRKESSRTHPLSRWFDNFRPRSSHFFIHPLFFLVLLHKKLIIANPIWFQLRVIWKTAEYMDNIEREQSFVSTIGIIPIRTSRLCIPELEWDERFRYAMTGKSTRREIW